MNAVIVTGMNMPTACKDCEYPNCDYYKAEWCRHGENSINYMTARSDGCPLRSIDGLIERIENKKYDKPFGTEEARHNDTIDMCIDFIKEYCEVKE